jgi:hypothetical protein
MKKINLLIPIAFLMFLIISGCGSNSKPNPIPPVEDLTNGYGFFNASTPVQVSQSNTEGNISVQLIQFGLAVAGKDIQFVPFDKQYGTIIESATVATDDTGYAIFKYLSPNNVSEMIGKSVVVQAVFNDDNGTSLMQEFVLQFRESDEVESQYTLVNESSPFVVTLPEESMEISAYVVDSNNIGVEGKEVSISVLTYGYGSLSPSKVFTDESGKAAFTYTGPTNLQGLSTTSVVLRFTENGVTQEKIVHIVVEPAPEEDTTEEPAA